MPDTAPLVSFIVPCYRLAHLVGDCVTSILNQTVDSLEVLVMDDCSPDDVAGALRPLADRRLRHIRHDQNRGHLQNYNIGLSMARGRYVWLISADDRLHGADAIERLIAPLERHPRAGLAFSPALRFGDTEVARYGCHGFSDKLFPSAEFARRMIEGNPVPAPSTVVRAACYRAGLRFPLDLPFVGDWYIWGRVALQHDVAYVADPVAEYRVHAGNMTKQFHADRVALVRNEIEVRWRLRRDAEALGLPHLVDAALAAISWDYAVRVVCGLRDGWRYGMTMEEFEHSLCANVMAPEDLAAVRARVYAAVGDLFYHRGVQWEARSWYERALEQRSGDRVTRVKRRLLALGPLGAAIRHIAESRHHTDAPARGL